MITLRESSVSSRPVIKIFIAATLAILLVAPSLAYAQVAQAEPEYTGSDRIEKWKGKTVLAVTPHPDDETFTSGGLLSMLAANGNNVQILIYTSDNAGSNDPAMTKEKLAAIRRGEEEDACAILGIPKDHITWLGHDDGMLEYVDRRELTRQVAREIRRHRPDAVLSIDPGAPYEQWHKSDHRSAAVITADAMRAAAWRLYFPELERAGIQAPPGAGGVFLFFQPAQLHGRHHRRAREEGEGVGRAHQPVWRDARELRRHEAGRSAPDLAKTLMASPLIKRKNGRPVEHFRRSTAYGG